MKTSDFYYDLPQELIAQDPLGDRASSRLFVLDKSAGTFEHRIFRDIVSYLQAGDVLVINNTKVIPARLIGQRLPRPNANTQSQGRKASSLAGSEEKKNPGARCEVLLLEKKTADDWECLVRPGKKLRTGDRIVFGNGLLEAEITDMIEGGNRIVHFHYEGIFEEILDTLGQMPLPPYITHELKDKNRYQTVYARYDGSAAAPTAGLHFTPELLGALRERGVEIEEVTLHVGLGTFRPVKVEDVASHHMHSEFYRISEQTAQAINRAKAEGRRIIAVGTTSTRTLESAADENGILHAAEGYTDIFIYPGYRFKVVDALITNFHLPESTLMMLVSALAGRDLIMRAYAEAIRERYRFFSFGDAMLII